MTNPAPKRPAEKSRRAGPRGHAQALPPERAGGERFGKRSRPELGDGEGGQLRPDLAGLRDRGAAFGAGGRMGRRVRCKQGFGAEGIASASSGSILRLHSFTTSLPTTTPSIRFLPGTCFLTVPRGICLISAISSYERPVKWRRVMSSSELGREAGDGPGDGLAPLTIAKVGVRIQIGALVLDTLPGRTARGLPAERSEAGACAGGRSRRFPRSGRARSRT